MTGEVNNNFRVAVNVVIVTAPFWLLMQLRGVFGGVGGVVAIVGGVGDLPVNALTTTMRLIWSSFAFLNLDIAATRPGCGGTASTFVPIYWADPLWEGSYL